MTAVSIVLPTYNDAHFLPKAIESCLHQPIEKEILIIDDASTTPFPQNVLDLINNNKETIRIVRHDKNSGLSASRNTGISQAKHNLIIPIDADDWFFPNVLHIMAARFGDGVDIVYGNVFDNGPGYPQQKISRKEQFIGGNPLFCSSMYRKSVWERAGGYTVREGPHYEDWNFWAKAFKAGCKFHYVPIMVYNHTSRPDSMLRVLHPNREHYQRLAIEGVF